MISVSYIKSKLNTIDTIKKIDESIADQIHVDLIDGIYCGNNNFQIDEVVSMLKDVSKPLDIHLMVKNPEYYLDKLFLLNPKCITIHINSTSNIKDVFMNIKNHNIKVGIAINPNEDIKLIDDYIDMIDYVLIMGVYPGEGGQEFIPSVIDKVKYLEKYNVLVGIDGGINGDTIKSLKDLKIDNIVSGSFVCMSDNYNDKITILQNYKI